MSQKEELAAVGRSFQLAAPLIDCQLLKVGHIHTTWILRCAAEKRYILQKINQRVFPQPQLLIENVAKICTHLSKRPLTQFQTISLVAQQTGQFHFCDDHKNYWRCYKYVENSRYFSSTQSEKILQQAGYAFGSFVGQLSDYDKPYPPAALPGFHDGLLRFQQLEQAVLANRDGRVKQVSAEIDLLFGQRQKMCLLSDLLAQNKLPLRLCHNDTKINNVLFDSQRPLAVCVIDLDTVMPGTLLYDFGDLVRSSCSGFPEDDEEIGQAEIQVVLFEAVLSGFLKGCGAILSSVEIDYLLAAVETMALNLASRFLSDFLNGDRYFRINFPGHNLARARNQLAFWSSLQSKQGQLEDAVARILGERRS